MQTLRRLFPIALAAAVLSACSSGGSSTPVGTLPPNNYGGGSCNPGTSVQLANPQPYQTGVSPSIGSVTIVANGNNNTLYSNYPQWQVVLLDSYGDPPILGGALQLVADPNGPHPFGSDFYYSSSLNGQSLTPGLSWNAYLAPLGQQCGPQIGSFQT